LFKILKLFCIDIEAKKVTEITKISRSPTVRKIFDKIRVIMVEYCQQNSLFEKGKIELDESYFGSKWDGQLYTQIIKNCSMSEIIPIIERQADKTSTIYTDGLNI